MSLILLLKLRTLGMMLFKMFSFVFKRERGLQLPMGNVSLNHIGNHYFVKLCFHFSELHKSFTTKLHESTETKISLI